jgi:type II secretory pathway pseudopilin PulG
MCTSRPARPSDWLPPADSGFALVETLVATLVLAAGVMALAYLAMSSARAQVASRQNGLVTQLALDKIEQLRVLAWTSDAAVVPVTDWSSDVAAQEPAPAGGTGLGLSPPGSLSTNVPGFCDFLDAQGRWLGSGGPAPPGAAWVRRWSVTALPDLADTLALTVVVAPAVSADADGVRRARTIAGARLLAVRTRRAR